VRFALLLFLLFAPQPLIAQDREQGTFTRCSGSGRVTCVVDGDTIWYRGDKIRIADINTPEISRPACATEAELGERATQRLTILLNSGRFSLLREGRDTDRYGRLLRLITRDGQSLGAVLVSEGLAEVWQGRRGDWCGA
jgi:micrococcal nuclease